MTSLNEAAMQQAREKWDSIAHPLHGLGLMEDMVVQIAGITGSADISLDKKQVFVFCGDNGISETAVSQSESSVTAMVADEIAEGKSSVNRMADVAGAEVSCIDVGIKDATHSVNIIHRNVIRGTKNFITEPAMTPDEAEKCVEAGTNAVRESDADIIAVGEMGIADTTCASVITASLLHLTADDVCGRGAGLSNEGLAFKKRVIDDTIKKYDLYHVKPQELLRIAGGAEIAAMTGAFIGGAIFHKPMIADGAVCLSAALLAEEMVPGTREYMLASHQGREKISPLILHELGLRAPIHADLSLGEGTGAVMLFQLLDQTLSVYNTAHSFDSMNLEPYK